ncbi:cation diffusion facilitator family transporter [uncultured Jatrophihabitans sp.]|uniref:cation diffusion facilitator family transporter n=1 Tax=uncultured Jatrophihabitans sp. TaxID=1610747 RepID=UPI0035CA8DF7
MTSETRGTVVVALAANIGVAVIKLAAGLVTGSAAVLSEAAHSVADTLNEVFLLVSLRRSERPADATHPFGYGKERFFYALMAAIGIFLSGAAFSAYQGVSALVSSASDEQPSLLEFVMIYVVLAVSLVLEGASLHKAAKQVRGEAARANRGVVSFVVRSPDPTVKTVAGEDSVAVIGVLTAAVGTMMHQITGVEAWDGVASLVIAALLGYMAVVLGRDTKELLIGESADPVVRATAFAVITSRPEITGVKEVLTMQLGPSSVLLAARVQFEDDLAARRVQLVCTDIEGELRQRLPELTQVFLDPSAVTTSELADTQRRERQTLVDVDELNGPGGAEALRLPRRRSARRTSSTE